MPRLYLRNTCRHRGSYQLGRHDVHEEVAKGSPSFSEI